MTMQLHICYLWVGLILFMAACTSLDSQHISADCLVLDGEEMRQICRVAHRGENLLEAIAAIKQSGHKQHYPQLDHTLTLIEGVTTVQGTPVSGTFYWIGFVDRQTGHLIHEVTDVVSEAGDHYVLMEEVSN